jgi:hypothetical protein
MASPAPPSNAPNPFYRRHHSPGILGPEISDRMFRQGWRIRDKLQELVGDRLISPGAWLAASQHRDAHALAFSGGVGSHLDAVGAGRRPKGAGKNAALLEHSEAQLDAARRLRAGDRALGPTIVAILRAFVLENLRYCALANRFGTTGKTMKKWVVEIIRALAEIW